MTDAELEKINAERRRRGLPPLTRPQAQTAMSEARSTSSDPGFDMTGFLIGYTTGIPISPSQGISMGSIVGAALHESEPSRPSEPSYNAPEPSAPSPSYESSSSSSSSSYDSSSSSSSSYDSGSSSFSSD